MKRALKIAALLLTGGIIAVALLVALLLRGAAPVTSGLRAEDFDDKGRDAISASVVVSPSNETAARPNFVVILADDLGYGDTGIYGGRAIKTPNIDLLAQEGLRFTHAYASAPICSPSRAALLTGRYPLRSGVTTALQMAGDSAARKASYQAGLMFSHVASVDMIGGHSAVLGLPPSEITLPEVLREAGYHSKAIGKWHLGDFTQWPEYHPMNQGFDEFVGFNGSNDDFPIAFWRGEEQVIADIGADQQAYTGIFTEEAVKFIDESDATPFLIYLAHKDPHLPFFPSEKFAGNSEGGPYGDAVTELDWSVGEVVAALQRKGIAENTLIIFTSDNGPWFEGSPGGLRGRKGQSHEGGFRVPLIAWWPGTIEAGRVSDVPVMNIDFLPTFAALAGLSPPSDRTIDGADVSPILLGQSGLDERALYFFHDYAVEAIRRGSWKYYARVSHYTWPVPLDNPVSFFGKVGGARDYVPVDGGEPVPTLGTWPNLYHLERDPDESYDVVRRYPDVAESLDSELRGWSAAFYANPRGWSAR